MGRRSNGWSLPGRRVLGQRRARTPGWKALALVVGGLLGGCGPREVNAEARLLTGSCSGPTALTGVRYLRWRVTGTDMQPVERYVPVESAGTQVPAFPVGRGRVVEVRGYTDLPRAGGRVVALGRSRPFDVPDTTSVLPSISIAVRRVGEYVRPGDARGGCVTLAEARAGHTATLLEDGRVLLVGGIRLGSDGTPSTLASTELFDPISDTLTGGPEGGIPRAFHTATRLPGGTVLLAGGEEDSAAGTRALSSAWVVDVAKGTSTNVELQAARSHHAAAVDAGGHVLLVGGRGTGGGVVAQAEGYDATTGQVLSVETPVARVGMSVMAVEEGQRIAVVGGSDGSVLRPEVLFFGYTAGAFTLADESGALREPRREGALVAWGGARRWLYVGGLGSLEESSTLASSEVLFPKELSRVEAGPQVFPRSGLCAVALPDGRVMTLGGMSSTFGARTSDAHAELLFPAPDGGAPAMLGMRPLDRGALGAHVHGAGRRLGAHRGRSAGRGRPWHDAGRPPPLHPGAAGLTGGSLPLREGREDGGRRDYTVGVVGGFTSARDSPDDGSPEAEGGSAAGAGSVAACCCAASEAARAWAASSTLRSLAAISSGVSSVRSASMPVFFSRSLMARRSRSRSSSVRLRRFSSALNLSFTNSSSFLLAEKMRCWESARPLMRLTSRSSSMARVRSLFAVDSNRSIFSRSASLSSR